MQARKITATIVENSWITPSVMGIRFQSSKKFQFEPGQFLGVVVPAVPGVPHHDPRSRAVKRAYSLASPPELAHENIYELCVKFQEGGRGSEYLASLKAGYEFSAFAPYGDFVCRSHPGRGICIIATGSGIAPFRSVLLSNQYRENPPEQATVIFGARTVDEVIYPGLFESLGAKTVIALTKAGAGAGEKFFQGRVTDYLRSLPIHWPWHTTDFYICGNSQMANEVVGILRQGHGVPSEAIHQEVFFLNRQKDETPVELKTA